MTHIRCHRLLIFYYFSHHLLTKINLQKQQQTGMLIRNIFKNRLLSKLTTLQHRFSSQSVIYLDYQATTPIDYRVMDAMTPYMLQYFGNPHSKTHQYGWDGSKGVEVAREQIADLIHADPREIIFTSGATQSNNMVLKGLAAFYGKERKHIITTQIQHKCILDTCRHLEAQGFRVTYLPLKNNGILDLDLLKKTIDESKEKVLCVSTIFVNNQIGVLQPVAEIGKICREKGVFYHTDAAQAVGKVPVDVNQMNIDLLSISGHKIYGPKGIGALYIRRKPRVRILPLFNGGGQERGLRSGTLAPALIVGLGKACEVAKREMKNDHDHVTRLYNKILKKVRENITHCQLNGDENQRYMGNLNLSFAYVEGESLLMALKKYAVSSGSACTSESLEPSYVLRAVGVSEDLAHTSLRIGLGRFTLESEVDEFLAELEKAIVKLRELSPLWEMVNEGVDISAINWSQPH